jgi:hypothetical protein
MTSAVNPLGIALYPDRDWDTTLSRAAGPKNTSEKTIRPCSCLSGSGIRSTGTDRIMESKSIEPEIVFSDNCFAWGFLAWHLFSTGGGANTSYRISNVPALLVIHLHNARRWRIVKWMVDSSQPLRTPEVSDVDFEYLVGRGLAPVANPG